MESWPPDLLWVCLINLHLIGKAALEHPENIVSYMAQIKAKVSLAGSRGAWTARTRHVALDTVLDAGIHPRGYLGKNL